ncbi:MAG: DNA alkylation repair protein [Alphaproteobacteria bacterium]|nr:DNA alkylation repair protein [Alphaproteobacteria bacterium]
MHADLGAAIAAAKDDLRAHGDKDAARERKRYLKTPFEVLGCGVPVVNAAAKQVRRAMPSPDREVLAQSLDTLWASPVHDDELLAIVLAGLYQRLFTVEDLNWVFLGWLRDCRTWDHVDTLATRIIGEIAARDPRGWTLILRWAEDPAMWLRRASLLAHIPAIRRDALEADLLQQTCLALVEEAEFFIRKAIGWVLRELGKRDAELA